MQVFGHEAELGRRVVVVGGSETGMETALYLAEHGHEVTVLSRQRQLASDANQIHYMAALKKFYSAMENFHYAVNAATTLVTPEEVRFTVKTPPAPEMPPMPGMPPMPKQKPTGPYGQDGDYVVACDSVVVCGGVESRADAGLRYSGCARQFFLIGDCETPGRVYQATRSAFAAASQI